MIGKLFKRLFKQHPISWLGAFNTLHSKTMFYLGLSQFVMLGVTTYSVASGKMMSVLPWLNFPLFMLLLFVGYAIMLCLAFIFALPSDIKFSQSLAYKHGSPVKKDFEALNKRLDKQDEDFKRLTALVQCRYMVHKINNENDILDPREIVRIMGEAYPDRDIPAAVYSAAVKLINAQHKADIGGE